MRDVIVRLCLLVCMIAPTLGKTELLIGVLSTWQGGVWKIPQVLLGILPALDKINNDPNLLPDYNVTFKWSDTQCKTPHASKAALSLLTVGVDVLIGSPCSGDSIEVAPTSSYFKVPMISYYSVTPKLSNKVKYPWFSRVLGTTRTYDAVAIGFLKHFGMRHAAPVYPIGSTFALHWSETMRASLIAADITIDAEIAYTDFGLDEVNRLKRAGVRVVIWLDYNCGRMRSLLFEAHQNGILKDWLWILDGVSTGCWQKGDEKDAVLLQAFNGMYSIHPYFFVKPEDYDFLDASKPRLGPYLQPVYGAAGSTYSLDDVPVGKNMVGTPLLHDAILLWAHAAQAVISKGGDCKDPSTMQAEIVQMSMTGMTGSIILNAEGDRKAAAEMKLVTINSAGDGLKMESCAQYDGVNDQFTMVMPETSLVFAGGATTLPLDFSLACPSGSYTNTDRLECMFCPPGRFASGSQFDRYNCSLCGAGTYAPNPGQSECFPCPGYVTSNAGAASCTLCGPGYFNSPSTSDALCRPCEKGKYSDMVAMNECSDCQPGLFSSIQGSTQCETCSPGQYSDKVGTTECTSCGIGTYSLRKGSGSCELCPLNTTTQLRGATDESYCVCGAVQFAGKYGCESCPEVGMNCPGGHPVTELGEQDNTPLIRAGFMVLPSSPFDVYTCVGDSKYCSQDRSIRAVATMCPPNFDLVARCSTCQQGYFFTKNGCESCDDSSGGIVFLQVLGGALIQTLAVTYMYIRWNRDMPPGLITIGSIVVFVQMLGVIGRLDLDWKDPLKSISRAINDIFSIKFFWKELLQLRWDCHISPTDLGWTLMFDYLSPFFIGISFLVIGLVAYVVKRPLQKDLVLNLIGRIFAGLYVTMTSMTLQLFAFDVMPSGKLMVQEFPSVAVGSDEWVKAVPMAVVAFFLYCIGFFAYVARAVWVAPRAVVKDSGFVARFRFAFVPFRPDCWWWILAKLIFALSLNIVRVIGSSPVAQIILMFSATCIMMVSLHYIRPFKYIGNNYVEIVFKASLLMVLLLSMCLIHWDLIEVDKKDAIKLGVTYGALFAIIVALLGATGHVAHWCWHLRHPDHSKLGSKIETMHHFRCMALQLLLPANRDFNHSVEKLSGYDFEMITQVMNVINSVFFKEQPSKHTLKQRLMPGVPIACHDNTIAIEKMLTAVSSGTLDAAIRRNLNEGLRLGQVFDHVDAIREKGDLESSVVSHTSSNRSSERLKAILVKRTREEELFDIFGSDVDKASFEKKILAMLQTSGSCHNPSELVSGLYDLVDSDDSGHMSTFKLLSALQGMSMYRPLKSQRTSGTSNSDAISLLDPKSPGLDEQSPRDTKPKISGTSLGIQTRITGSGEDDDIVRPGSVLMWI